MELKANDFTLDHDEPPKAMDRLEELRQQTSQEAAASGSVGGSPRTYTSARDLSAHLDLLTTLLMGSSGEAASLAAVQALLERQPPKPPRKANYQLTASPRTQHITSSREQVSRRTPAW